MFEGEKPVLDYEHDQAKDVRVRVPLPNREQFLDNLAYFAERDDRRPTVKTQADFYLLCREQEIHDEIGKIRKSIKRISRNKECMSLVKKWLAELDTV